MSVLFHSTEKRFTPNNLRKRREWILGCIRKEKFSVNTIQFIFCSDEFLLEINRKFLKHNYFTDVITFPECSDKSIGGEIYISIERVKENAKLFKVDFETELNRIIIHGVLHLMKYTDSKISDKSVMTAKENLLLSLF